MTAAGAGLAPASEPAATPAPQAAASGPSTTAASPAVQSAAAALAATAAPLAPIVQHLLAHLSDPQAVVEDVVALLAGMRGPLGIAAPELHKLIDQLVAMHAVTPAVATALHQLVELTKTARELQQFVSQLPGLDAVVVSALGKIALLTGLPSLQDYLAQLVAPGASGPPSLSPVSTPSAITPVQPTGLSPLPLPAAPGGAGLAVPVAMAPVLWLHQPLGSSGRSGEVGVAEPIVSAPASTEAGAFSAASASHARVAAHATPAQAEGPRVPVQAPHGPGPASPGAGAGAGGAASALAMAGAIAALLAALSLTAPRLVRRLRLPPALWRPVAFVSLLERPG